MTYEFNPHQHVKIWLSKDRDVFLNQENQLRLVKMRAMNPNDVIHLVYAEELLSSVALAALNRFCEQHHIDPVSIEKRIVPHCLDEDELQLIALYQQEIRAIHGEGGSLAAASDILRWLKPVYSLGVYSDLDVIPNTKGLDLTVRVEAPMLCSIGSVVFPIAGLPRPIDVESITLNNDMIAVVGDDELTRQKVKAIQKQICRAYQDLCIYEAREERFARDLTDLVRPQVGYPLGLLCAAQTLLSDPSAAISGQLALMSATLPNYSPIELRRELIKDRSTTNDAYCLSKVAKVRLMYPPGHMTDALAKQMFVDILRQQIPGTMTDDERLNQARDTEYQVSLVATVVNTTGPSAVMLGLFDHVLLTHEELNEKVSPYAFDTYPELKAAFISDNSLGSLHLDSATAIVKMTGEIGSRGDQSWTEKGASAIVEREDKMIHAARDIQRAYKSYQARTSDDTTPDDQRSLKK